MRAGAKEFLQNICTDYKIKIFTTRDEKLVARWVNDNGLEEYISGITNIKEPAYLYIDDRSISFNGDYKKLSEEIILKFGINYLITSK